MAIIKEDDQKPKACRNAGCQFFYNKYSIPDYCGKVKAPVVKLDFCPLWADPYKPGRGQQK